MFCPECGARVDPSQKFCKACGTVVQGAAPGTAGAQSPPPLPGAGTRAARREPDAEGVYASFWRRVGASLLDALIVYVPLSVISLFVWSGQPLSRFLFSCLVQLIYTSVMHSSNRQATLGKMIVGIKVTSVAGERISLGHAVGRYFAHWLDFFVLGTGDLWMLFNRRSQTFHDLVAQTLVVRESSSPQQIVESPPAPRSVATIILVLVLFFGVFVLGILAAIAIPAYQDYIIRAQITQGLQLAGPVRTAVERAIVAGVDPRTLRAADLKGVVPASGPNVELVDVENGAVVINYGKAANALIRGQSLALHPYRTTGGGVAWACGYTEANGTRLDSVVEGGAATTVPAKYLPRVCRGD